ncbi:WXG100-like domain-containing protein [Nocardioides sp. URHA0032]|uniref:WXG100-like domain-containing protein n=1 Tax=Nocardioides sp. URHA0032 TaxID=1380388 RepID=UPI0004913DBF|nr:hypothetical protein [Nocardioides sp. URHA0032]
MRLLIDGGGYTTATSAFGHANHAAALRCDSLSAALAGYAAMAGDSSSSADFAETYDAAAADGLAALADLADSFAGLGRLTHGSHQNHRAAEGLAGLDDVAYTGVRPTAPPSSLGGDPSGLPDTLNWLLDHVEAFIWPDADVDRLRTAGATWRGAAGGLAALVDHCDLVVSALGEEHSPEIPLALDAVRTLKGGICDLAEQYVAIAGACEQYADQVEQQRAAMLDFLFDLLRDSLIIEGIGIGLSFVTAGGTAAGATAINIARVGAEMPRILQFVEAVRTAAAAAAAVMRSAGEIVLRARSTFGRFAGLVLASDARALTMSTADLERLRRVGLTFRDQRMFDPHSLRGLSRHDLTQLLSPWDVRPAKRGEGLVFTDPIRNGRQIRLMDGYPGNRPDPITHGPYAVVSQNSDKPIKIALEGNPTL